MSSPAWRRLPWAWGSPGAAEVPEGRDGAEVPGGRVAVRAVETDADPDELFLWLCQLRRAPYSYDWIDNVGRRSPRDPDPSMPALEVGQSVMTIFTLTAYVPGRSLTLRMNPGPPSRIFGAITVRYDIERVGKTRSQLRATLWLPPIGGPLGGARRYLLAWGDLLMMRKQLLVLTALAERTSSTQDVTASTMHEGP